MPIITKCVYISSPATLISAFSQFLVHFPQSGQAMVEVSLEISCPQGENKTAQEAQF